MESKISLKEITLIRTRSRVLVFSCEGFQTYRWRGGGMGRDELVKRFLSLREMYLLAGFGCLVTIGYCLFCVLHLCWWQNDYHFECVCFGDAEIIELQARGKWGRKK